MGMFRNLQSLFRPVPYYVYGGDWGVSVAEMDAATLYRTQPNLRAAVGFLADNAAQVPLKVHERAGQNDRPRVTDSPAALLLQHPNDDMTPFEFRRWMYSDLLLYERFLMLVLPNKKTESGWEMRPIPNAWVIAYNGSSPFAPESVDIMPPGLAPVRVPANRFVLFHGYDPTDPMRQYSRISALKETLHEQVESNRFRRQMWQRGGRFNAYLTRPKDVQQWTDEGFERFKTTWKASWAGNDAAEGGGMPILEDGMEIKTVQFNSRDAQWAEAVKLAREDVAAIYRFNPALLWPGTGQTYASARDNARALYNDCLAPTLMQATDRINQVLLPMVGEPASHYVVYDITIKTQGTLEERISALQTACGGPFMSRQEVRALMDLPAEPDGDLIVPLNVLLGGLASSHDTDPTVERYNSLAQAIANAERILGMKSEEVELPKAVEPPAVRKAKGEPAEDEEQAMVDAYRRFFERQAKSVLPKIESREDPKTDLSWWNAERWNNELADDLYPVAIAIGDAAGERAVRELWPDDKTREYGKRQTAKYIRRVCEARARMANAATLKQLLEVMDGGKAADVDVKGLRDTLRGAFEFAIANRSVKAGLAFSAWTSSWATMEAARQNRKRGENVFKTWKVRSSNPRSSHKAMDGERVQYDELFSNGMKWPGDWENGSAAEVAFCKCALEIDVEECSWIPGRVTVEQIEARSDLSVDDKEMLKLAVVDYRKTLGFEESKKLADRMIECMAVREDVYRHSTVGAYTEQLYNKTVCALLSDIGDVYGMKLTCEYKTGVSWFDRSKIVESGMPKGEEVWAITRPQMREKFGQSEVNFPHQDHGRHKGNPDLLVNGEYMEIKTPDFIENISNNIQHGYAQCDNRGHNGGVVILNTMKLKKKSEKCLYYAEKTVQRKKRNGQKLRVYVIDQKLDVHEVK